MMTIVISTIQGFCKNNYKEGDEIDFSLGWGICEARTGTGEINTYFANNEQGEVEILDVKYLNLEESIPEDVL